MSPSYGTNGYGILTGYIFLKVQKSEFSSIIKYIFKNKNCSDGIYIPSGTSLKRSRFGYIIHIVKKLINADDLK